MHARDQLLQLLEELRAISGVRAALLATSEGALASQEHGGLSEVTANDVAKTVRRMTVASATVGVPLKELLINFGAARMMVTPLSDEATVVCLLERDTVVAPVRSLLKLELARLRGLLEAEDDGLDLDIADEGDDEIDRIMHGELGPVLGRIRRQFALYVTRTGSSSAAADEMMREQMREWLLCCNPSTYTFPLLIDGLGQLLNDFPSERGEFMRDVQTTIREAQSAGG